MNLFIDTSTDKTIIALGKKAEIINKKIFKVQYRQSEMLLPAINQLLRKNKLKLKDLSGIIVISGPGHYTGLRVGVTTANALAFGLKIPVVGVRNRTHKTEKLFQTVAKRLQSRKFKIKNLVTPFYSRKLQITPKSL